MRRIVALTIMLVAFLSSVLVAHEGHTHKVMGTVVAVEQGRLEVKTRDGKSVALVVDQKTKFVRGKEPAAPKDVAQGSRVVVTTVEESGVTRALEVRLPERKSQSSKTGTSPEK